MIKSVLLIIYFQVKAAALKLADMNAFLRKRQKEDDQLQEEIQEAFRDLNQLHEDKSLFDMNPQIQFLLRQGQVCDRQIQSQFLINKHRLKWMPVIMCLISVTVF